MGFPTVKQGLQKWGQRRFLLGDCIGMPQILVPIRKHPGQIVDGYSVEETSNDSQRNGNGFGCGNGPAGDSINKAADAISAVKGTCLQGAERLHGQAGGFYGDIPFVGRDTMHFRSNCFGSCW